MAFGSHPFVPARSDSPIGTVSRIARLKDEFLSETAAVKWTASQHRFLEVFFAGSNVCLTGSAGTGKSYVIQRLFSFLEAHGVSVGRTSTTGVSAFAIGGQTIHSWAGLGLADEHLDSILSKVIKNSKAKARMKASTILFIDEVSMAKGDLMDKLDGVLRFVRHSSLPWGGLHVVASGDFLQLGAVFKADEVVQLAFQSRAWKESAFKTVVLKEPVRQADGSVLLKVLNDIRVGDTSSLHLLRARVGATFPDSEVEPVRIFCRNVDVSEYNHQRLATLVGQPKTYKAHDTGQSYHIDAFNRNCPAPETLDLKVGAQVCLLTNLSIDDGLVNGSLGVVRSYGAMGVNVRFTNGESRLIDRNEWSIKEQEVGVDGKIKYKVVATRSQIPLKLCYSSTVHRAQGATLDRAIIDVSDAFATGQAYCALSRVRDLESLSLTAEIPARAVKVNQDCVEFYRVAEGDQS